MSKTTVVYVNFLGDVAWQKLLKSVNVSRSYSKNNTGTVFLRHGVVYVTWWLGNGTLEYNYEWMVNHSKLQCEWRLMIVENRFYMINCLHAAKWLSWAQKMASHLGIQKFVCFQTFRLPSVPKKISVPKFFIVPAKYCFFFVCFQSFTKKAYAAVFCCSSHAYSLLFNVSLFLQVALY